MARHFVIPVLIFFAGLASADEIPNPLIDYGAFKANVERVGELRESHRVTEAEFLRLAADPDTVVLDARSREKFELLHAAGAVNLSLPDVTEEELAKVIPSKATRILIYCNNNFANEPRAFPSKVLSASLNVYTMNVLYAYGYINVYELGPLIDIHKTMIPFERTTHPQAVNRPTTLRTHGATKVTVGNATGQVKAQLRSHCDRNPSSRPCVVSSTNADTMPTMMDESSAPKTSGANRAGMRISNS